MAETMTTMLARVQELTRRPDIQDTTKLAIRAATLRAHKKGQFSFDLKSTNFTYAAPSDGSAFVNLTSTLLTVAPQFRADTHIVGTDSVGNPMEFLDHIDPVGLFYQDGTRKTSVYVQLGQTLTIYPQLFTGYAKLFYYANPIVTDVSYSSWIADMYPDELAQWATAIVWMRTGRVEDAKVLLQGMINDFVATLIENHGTQGVR